MAIEYNSVPFLVWLIGPYGQGAWVTFLFIMAVLIPLGTLLGFLFTAARVGPGEAFYSVAGAYANLVKDVGNFSLRRTMAMSYLAFQEALRQKVLVVFAVVGLLMMLGGWFLDVESEDPARLYLGNVLWGTNILAVLMAVLLSAFSIPNDIKHRTIYTIVTKPVRYLELIFGRVIGFTMIGTCMLIGLCAVNLVFVERGMMHSHTVAAEDVKETRDDNDTLLGWTGETSRSAHHRHTFTLDAAGEGITNTRAGHWHEVTRAEYGTFTVGPVRDALRARVPIYGKLQFTNRQGEPVDRGINVGYEWDYRSFVEGATESAAIWTFEGIYEDEFPEGIPLELNLRVFRTHKGKMNRGVLGEMVVRNPQARNPDGTALESEKIIFETHEFTVDQRFIPRKLKARQILPSGEERLVDADLFKDFVTPDGRVQIIIRGAEPGQYLGMAQADAYIKAAEGSFRWNFVKGYMGIWMQMVLVICFGVMFSTVLNGPVALITTVGAIVLGFNREFILNVATGSADGGGPLESTIRMLTQQNVTIELDPSATVSTAQALDLVMRAIMWVTVNLLPDFSSFTNLYNHVSYGYDVSPDLLARHMLITLTYALVVIVVSYFLFRSKEVAG